MFVIFVSQCSKKGRARTVRILDTFANRIGDSVWVTQITSQGLEAVRAQLAKKASKNTAISCHWVRNGHNRELIWVVGSRSRFSRDGFIPVHTTNKLSHYKDTDAWKYLPVISASCAIASLLHDFGKASQVFQDKLDKTKTTALGDPLRHEWVSVVMLKSLILSTGATDEQWLKGLAEYSQFDERVKLNLAKAQKSPLSNLPPFAKCIAWLILTHHRMPLPDKQVYQAFIGEAPDSIDQLLSIIDETFGYENRYEDFEQRRELCFRFPNGLPSASREWQKATTRWSEKAIQSQKLFKEALDAQVLKPILLHTRTALMVGDREYSSRDRDSNVKRKYQKTLYANTGPGGEYKQYLDEHLIGVTSVSVDFCHRLAYIASGLDRARGISALLATSPAKYKWQEDVVERVEQFREEKEVTDFSTHGLFCLNMASTGCGKTIANAKIMRAISPDGESLRFVYALGLRSLTLQTGAEYRNLLGLSDSELAVLIGSSAVTALFEHDQINAEVSSRGSESLEVLLPESLDFNGTEIVSDLNTIITNKKEADFLSAPVLSCTIDHLMGATETKRGGRYILPYLRLLSSDLIIDEVDDFTGSDLVCLSRLIHLAGILGRKVLISSATIPPDLAAGFYRSYAKGYEEFAKTNHISTGKIISLWVDEFHNALHENDPCDIKNVLGQHKSFTDNRVKDLALMPPRRKANIISCPVATDTSEEGNRRLQYFNTIQHNIYAMHEGHHTVDEKTGKRVSFGVVRVANIKPCIDLGSFLKSAEWDDDSAVFIQIYHSRQVLLLRSRLEQRLDNILRRKEKPGTRPESFEHPDVAKYLHSVKSNNIIFILVTTPVEETGRDHDFDWAIIEPSSYRSIIQLAGRVLRHREKIPMSPNVGILEFNMRGIENNKKCFLRPGYEDDEIQLESHSLLDVLGAEPFSNGINSSQRIVRNEQLSARSSLIDLEHWVNQKYLNSPGQQGPEALDGYCQNHWWMTAIPQAVHRFRSSAKTIQLFYAFFDNELQFVERDAKGQVLPVGKKYDIRFVDDVMPSRTWIPLDFEDEISAFSRYGDLPAKRLIYGEIAIFEYESISGGFEYNDITGIVRA